MRRLGQPSTYGGMGLGLAVPAQLTQGGKRNFSGRNITPGGLRVHATAAPELMAEEMSDEKKDIQKMLNKPYKYGFTTIIESDVFPKGISEDVVRAISAKKNEPDWLLEFRCGLHAPRCCSADRDVLEQQDSLHRTHFPSMQPLTHMQLPATRTGSRLTASG
jgi:hypothetical protein